MQFIRKMLALFMALLLTGGISSKAVASKATQLTVRGIAMDAETGQPLSGIFFYDHADKQVGNSDAKGFFEFTIQVEPNPEFNFLLRIEKEGYAPFRQVERWADLGDPLHVLYYFGLRHIRDDSLSTVAFSEMALLKSPLSYQEIKSRWGPYEAKRTLEKNIRSAKSGNSRCVFFIEPHYYLVSDTGWIKLASEDDVILLNGNERVLANSLNHRLERGSIRSITPSDREKGAFELETD